MAVVVVVMAEDSGVAVTLEAEEASIAVVLVAVTSVAPVVVLGEPLTSGAVLLVRRTQTLEDRATAEVESPSACLVLQAESRTLRLERRASIRLYRPGNLWCIVPAEIRRVA